MATEVLEGTWEEITLHAKDLVGRKVRVFVLDDEPLTKPNKKALEVIRKVRERHKDMPETGGESGVDIVRHGREGEMFN